MSTILSGSAGTFSDQPLGFGLPSTNDGPTFAIASTMIASTVVARMPIRIAPLTLRTKSTSVSSRPSTKTSAGQVTSLPPRPSSTGTVVPAASGMRRTNPASTRPMIIRNRPMPTPIAVFSWVGTARNTAVRSPVSTRMRDQHALDDHQAHRVGPGHLRRDLVRDQRVHAQPGGQRQREPGHHAHQDRHHAGHQGGAGGQGGDRQLAAVGVHAGGQDQRVEHHDVGHREEGGEPTPDLAAQRRAARRDLEEPVKTVLRGTRGRVVGSTAAVDMDGPSTGSTGVDGAHRLRRADLGKRSVMLQPSRGHTDDLRGRTAVAAWLTTARPGRGDRHEAATRAARPADGAVRARRAGRVRRSPLRRSSWLAGAPGHAGCGSAWRACSGIPGLLTMSATTEPASPPGADATPSSG